MKYVNSLYFLFLLVCIFPSVGFSQAQMNKAEQTKTPSLAATGMLAFPEETAEDIVLRAHAYDKEAMVLASIGYSYGVGGFPKDAGLGSAWASSLIFSGDYEAWSITALFAAHEASKRPELDESKLLYCYAATSSTLAEVLKKANFGDMESICTPLEKKIGKSKTAEVYKKAEALKQTGTRGCRDAAAFMRELLARPATDEDCQKLDEYLGEFPAGALLFFVATTHDLASGKADLKLERLLEFLLRQKRKNMPSALEHLLQVAADILPYWLDKDFSGLKATIRAAHSGDTTAIRSLAEVYGNGIYGTMEQERLSLGWLQHAALGGDWQSMLRLSIQLFVQDRLPESWAFADIVKDMKVADDRTRKMAKDLTVTIESRASEEIMIEGVAYSENILDELLKRLEIQKKKSSE